MSHKKNFSDGSFSEILYSLWDGENQITAWRRSKDQTRQALVRSSHERKKMFTLKSQLFVTPRRETV